MTGRSLARSSAAAASPCFGSKARPLNAQHDCIELIDTTEADDRLPARDVARHFEVNGPRVLAHRDADRTWRPIARAALVM